MVINCELCDMRIGDGSPFDNRQIIVMLCEPCRDKLTDECASMREENAKLVDCLRVLCGPYALSTSRWDWREHLATLLRRMDRADLADFVMTLPMEE